jgi:hypothetical protein
VVRDDDQQVRGVNAFDGQGDFQERQCPEATVG